ncbi:hypothetical protein NDR87_30570 [Nocardia sp. CDC159]|uniref:Uncharacterized protein n=1 Tax=Nocardia pulmonis TaxID=2951408 RepID=A0A9X2EE73_9NOCA|nr:MULTISPECIES: hypothetical protein [Nocardia]MCM6777840.1 hypothetical protein [Nocardia pulmonis]MCM6790724.1 hypothetical protein [Nocardia sp. CDC159]
MVTDRLSGLPAYSEFVAHVETAPPARPRWPFAVIVAVGLALILAPIITGMFPRAARGEAMIDAFGPYVSRSSIDGYRDDLRVLDGARANVLALRSQGLEQGRYDRVDSFVRDYPGIRSDISSMLDAIDANRDNYRRLADLPPIGALPWLLALAGVILTGAGVFGFRRAAAGGRGVVWRSIAALAALGLIAISLAGGLFSAASAGRPLIEGFRPILTHDEVREVQGYFVTLVAADGDLNSRYTGAIRAAHPDADLAGIAALEARWQPMTSRFAALIGTMNDNIDNFDAVAALDEATKPLRFTAFRGLGWFYLAPGVVVFAAAAAGLREPGKERQ